MRPIAFVDLDDTLFSTRRKNPHGLHPAAHDRAGEPLSFMSERQRAFLEWLRRDTLLVPTTGRNRAALERVRIRFEGYAICSFGGLILCPDGTPEPRWHTRMAEAAAGHAERLADYSERTRAAAAELGVDARVKVIEDAGLPFYVSAKHNAEDAPELARLADACTDFLAPGWQLHLNDNNLSLMPPFLGKERAVAWFLDELAAPGSFALGIGDSITDVPFMSLCDYALTPSQSQLFALLLRDALR